MFELKENAFVDTGICKYIDEYGNRLFMKREYKNENQDGFVAKIRFNNKSVKADSIRIQIPVPKNEAGTNLHLNYTDGIKHNEPDVQAGITGLTTIVQHWITMLYDIKFLNFKNEYILKNNPDCSIEDVLNYKISRLQNYEELAPLMESMQKS